MLTFVPPNNGKKGQALDRRPVSLSLLQGRVPRVRPRAFPERTLVMSKKITIKAGSKRMKEPRLAGDILQEMYMGRHRNPHVFSGEYITVTRRDDGSLCPNFKPMKVNEDFSVYRYALGVFNELMWALEDLVEK